VPLAAALQVKRYKAVIRDKSDHTGPEDFHPFSVTAHLSFPKYS